MILYFLYIEKDLNKNYLLNYFYPTLKDIWFIKSLKLEKIKFLSG